VVCFLALFTVLFAGTATVGKVASLIVPAEDRGGGTGESGWFNYAPGSGLDDCPDLCVNDRSRVRLGALDEVDDATIRGAVQLGLVFLPAAAVLLFHIRRRRALVAGEGFVGSAPWRTDRTYLYLACVVAVIAGVIGAASAVYDVVRIITPDITTSGPRARTSEREAGLADLITMTVLTLGATVIFFTYWSQVSGEANPLRRLWPFGRSKAEADDADEPEVEPA